MQDKCWVGGSTLMVSSVDDLKSYSHVLALSHMQEDMKTKHIFCLLLPMWVQFLGAVSAFFTTIGSQLIFLISRPLPSAVMGAIE